MHQSLPEARILPANPGAKRTTGRTGIMARAAGIMARTCTIVRLPP